MAERHVILVQDVEIEGFLGGDRAGKRTVGAAHPADDFGPATVELLAGVTCAQVACVNPRGLNGPLPSLDNMVDRVEALRQSLGIGPWIFWGMSGGGWLAQIYA